MEKINDYEVIKAWVYNPTKSLFGNKNDKALFHVVECNSKEGCGLYKKNQCIKLKMFDRNCPYGKRTSETGFTQRARKFNSWIGERKNKYPNQRAIKEASEKMASVGDYIYFPYSHIKNYGNNSIKEFTGGIIKKELFTPEMVVRVLKLKPQAMFGGEITSYQKKIVPKIAKHLLEVYPDLYSNVERMYPEIEELSTSSNVGRKAKLSTINKDVEVKINASHRYFWDGEYLTSESHAPLLICGYDELNVRIKPKKNVVIEITNDNQVNKNTEFIN